MASAQKKNKQTSKQTNKQTNKKQQQVLEDTLGKEALLRYNLFLTVIN
jgi:hypothetical protein